MSPRAPMDFATLLAASVHDMKNSIGMLMHLIEELQQQLPEDDSHHGQLSFEASRLNNYLIQLMTLYKLEHRQYRFDQTEHYLDEFIDDIVSMNRTLLSSRGVEIERQVDEDLFWEFDGQLVGSVLGTLFSNVVRYADAEVQISANRVRVSAEQISLGEVAEEVQAEAVWAGHSSNGENAGPNLDKAEQVRPGEGDYLCIAIEDDGPGFPSHMLGRLDRISMGVDFVRGSTGFGLYFSQQVAAAHRLDNRCGFVQLGNDGVLGGGRFQLYLP